MSSKPKLYSFRWPVFLLFIIPIILLSAYIGYRIYLITRVLPVGSGPAGPEVSQEHFQKIWSGEKVVLVGLGDSITAGFGAPKKRTYFSLLQNNDDSQYPDMVGYDLKHVLPNLEACNYVVNCSITQDHLEKQLPQLPTWPSDVKGIVVITSGGNDLIHSYGRSEPKDGAMYGCTYKQAIVWTENIKQRIQKLLEGVMSNFPYQYIRPH